MGLAVKKTISLPPEMAKEIDEIAQRKANQSALLYRMPYVLQKRKGFKMNF